MLNFEKETEIMNYLNKEMKEIDGFKRLTLLCAIIDMVASLNNKKTMDMMEDLLPIIKDVNEMYGQMIV